MPIKAVHIDLDGVVFVDPNPIPGASEAIAQLRKVVRVLFVSNATKRTREQLAQKSLQLGIPAAAEDFLTAGHLAVRYMATKKPRARVFLIAEGELDQEMRAAGLSVTRKEEHADFVFVGYDERTDYKMMNTAMRLIMEGAELIGGSDLRTWPSSAGQQLANGPIVKALEYATGATAVMMGKPEPSFFKAALALTQSAPQGTLFVSDDLLTDIQGAKALGIRTVLVETGTHNTADCERLNIHPDHIVPSLADVPALVEKLNA
ncbi:MAG TPA: HAD-IIA family hydrolase [archaeon]|nr:HAD-IIA family hydrolase [archaeon]